ncbi:hypothetical protein BDR26DRAFT_939252 [Obelidium mucronatum]|nr:hypothetical protein BDR26DRAFT_939252 [Obelidium mucronatum]
MEQRSGYGDTTSCVASQYRQLHPSVPPPAKVAISASQRRICCNPCLRGNSYFQVLQSKLMGVASYCLSLEAVAPLVPVLSTECDGTAVSKPFWTACSNSLPTLPNYALNSKKSFCNSSCKVLACLGPADRGQPLQPSALPILAFVETVHFKCSSQS